jgi:hypothetical protein
MNIFYAYDSSVYNNYNFTGFIKSPKKITDIQKEISNIPNFCRTEQSISVKELKSYLVSGISFFTEDINILGLINFDINVSQINILGLCAPEPSAGIGSLLIKSVKDFAQQNKITLIKLTCYDEVHSFYEKQGFKIREESTFYDSDDEDDKIRYEMEFYLKQLSGGKQKTRKRKIGKRTRKRTRKRKTGKTKRQKNKI